MPRDNALTGRARTGLAILALIAAVAGLYAPTSRHGFVEMDDPAYVYENPIVSGGLTVEGVRRAFAEQHAGYWLPLVWLSHMLDVELWGLDAGKHHAVNTALHALNAAMLLILLSRLTGEFGPSLCVAALFAVHPLHVESVAWVAERKDVLSGAFWLLTLLAWHAWVLRPTAWRYAGVLSLLAAGAMAKPMLVTLPCVLLLLDLWPLRRWRGTAARAGSSIPVLIREKLPLFAVAAGFAVATVLSQSRAGAVTTLDALSPATRLANAAVSYMAYLASAFWPAGLSPHYPHPAMRGGDPLGALAVPALVSLAALAAITAWTLGSIRLRPHRAVGWLWFVIVLAPVSGLLQAGTQARADRFVYLPLIGIYLLVSWEIASRLPAHPRARRWFAAAAAAVLICLALVTRLQVRHWKDSRTLLERALAVDPDNAWALGNLGAMDAREGDRSRALERCRRAAELAPRDPQAQFNLGALLESHGDSIGAAVRYERALALAPEHARAHNNLGSVRARAGDLATARVHFEQALRASPDFREAHNNLASVLKRTGDLTGAEAHYRQAITLSPRYAEAHLNLGRLLAASGRLGEAAAHYRAAAGGDPPLAEARDELARIAAGGG
jgi:Tfp pilus assembly protein PilF